MNKRRVKIVYISEQFAKLYFWEEALEPYLNEYALRFKDIILVSAIIPYEHYIGFLLVSHTNNSVSPKQIPWFSDWVKIDVKFHKNDILINMISVHFRKEIQIFSNGVLLLDKRNEIFGLKQNSEEYNR